MPGIRAITFIHDEKRMPLLAPQSVHARTQPVLPSFHQRNFHAQQQKPRTIIVSIFGGNNCKLCAKAAFWVQRILLSLPNASSSLADSEVVGENQRFRQVPTSLADVSTQCTYTPRPRGHGVEAARPQVNFSPGADGVAHRSALGPAGLPQSICGLKEGSKLHGVTVHHPAGSVVTVEVQQFNLDCMDTWQQLDLTEAEARGFKAIIPVVFVNGKQKTDIIIMAGRRDLNREPCPDRILDDMGGAFGMGALGGFLWHFAKGWRNSPKYEKFNGAMFSGSLKSPAVGSAFATWGGIFCAFDCTLAYARGGKEDSWNPVIAGAATGGILSMRSGWRSCARNAAVGGVLLGIIEVVQIMFLRGAPAMTPRKQFQQLKEYEELQQKAASSGQSSLWSRLLPSTANSSVHTAAPTSPGSSSEQLHDIATLR
ncbi:hypothetical protein Emed_001473 [Eimeria media]